LKSLADVQATASGEAFKKPVANFYQTNPIARASVTMAACTKAFVTKDYKIQDEDSGNSQVSQVVPICLMHQTSSLTILFDRFASHQAAFA
jgi:hypothetical protein